MKFDFENYKKIPKLEIKAQLYEISTNTKKKVPLPCRRFYTLAALAYYTSDCFYTYNDCFNKRYWI